MKKYYVITTLALLSFVTAWGVIPSGYYDGLNGITSPSELKTAVYTIINPHTTPGSSSAYSSYYNSLPTYFRQTDVKPGTEYWWDMYSDMDVDIYIQFGTYMNREHSFPKSWWGGSTTIPAYVDLNHLYPGNARANQAKSNYPLGEVNLSESVNFNNGVSIVGYAVAGQGGGAKYVFEPADEYKGDFARTYFYMVTCYQDLTWNTSYMFMLQQNTYPTLSPWASELLLRWSREDPVSEKEINRNEAVYKIQNNRNPFIDMPGLEEYIWGKKQGEKFEVANTIPGTEPNLISPTDGQALDFGECAIGNHVDSFLLFNGENLTGKISLSVTGANKDEFSLETTQLKSELVNQEGGYQLRVRFSPKTQGKKEAALTIYDVSGWGAGSMSVKLIAEAFPVPSLKTITALPASDITSDSYTANWEVPQGDVVDYYIVNRTRYIDGQSQVEQIMAESNSAKIEGYDSSIQESYTVQSARLGYRSQPSNVVYVEQSGIQGVAAEEPLVVEVYAGSVRIVCGNTQSNLRIFDIAGRLVKLIPYAPRNLDINLPYGAYFITTDQHHTPVKVLVQ